MNTFKRTQPWYFTEELMRKGLSIAAGRMTGTMLDAGCGASRYRDLFQPERYIAMDSDSRHSPDVVGDLRQIPLANDSLDSILSNQVLEHIDDTHAVISEFRRCLKSGGWLCLSVPFFARIHGAPHDYWRFSEFGLRYLLEKHGFAEIEVHPMGGFLTTQCYLWSFFLWEKLEGSTAGRFVRGPIAWVMNHLSLLISAFDKPDSAPFNYIAMGRKA